ncbi:MarR family winged helix-turn-helix transcriptional regulator [Streptomyces sp. NPDC058664]|uniref:MarR family winged helix-turn-helix transcriptional regulator n=1 Tax=unclassified Streptomyces TaxID=2593676 RepID=UPI00366384C4
MHGPELAVQSGGGAVGDEADDGPVGVRQDLPRRMQERGLVEREPAEHDRRVMRVRLTPKGEATRRPLEEVWATLVRASVRDLDERNIERFVAISETVTRAVLDRHSAAPWSRRQGAHEGSTLFEQEGADGDADRMTKAPSWPRRVDGVVTTTRAPPTFGTP